MKQFPNSRHRRLWVVLSLWCMSTLPCTRTTGRRQILHPDRCEPQSQFEQRRFAFQQQQLRGAKPDPTAPSQVFQLLDAGDGTFVIYNSNYKKAMDLALNGPKKPLQWDLNKSNPNQLLSLEPVQGKKDVYRLVSAVHSMYLLSMDAKGDVYGGLRYGRQRAVPLHRSEGLERRPRDQVQTEWQNEAIFAINKETGRATFMPYANSAALKADARFKKAGSIRTPRK